MKEKQSVEESVPQKHTDPNSFKCFSGDDIRAAQAGGGQLLHLCSHASFRAAEEEEEEEKEILVLLRTKHNKHFVPFYLNVVQLCCRCVITIRREREKNQHLPKYSQKVLLVHFFFYFFAI